MKTEMQQKPVLKPLVLEGPGPFVVIGDPHGCAEELSDLLARCEERVKNAQYLTVGDLTDRGPDVRKTIDLARAFDMKHALGNHEEKWIRASMGRPVSLRAGQLVCKDVLTEADFAYFKEMAPFIRLPYYKTIVVHGGFFPHREPERQDLKTIIRLRDIDPSSGKMFTLGEPGGSYWAKHWPQEREFVIFGHEPHEDVTQYPNALAIDTGCVFGGKLSAVIITPEGREIVQVRARRKYWDRADMT